MSMRLQTRLFGALAAALLGSCDSITEPDGAAPEGVRFSYSGASTGSFASQGNAVLGGDDLPAFESFAVAQVDSIGGLLVGGFRRTSESRGDLFILQLRGTDPLTYTCGSITNATSCYGHLYIGVSTDASSAADEVFGISAGQVDVSELSDSRLQATFQLALQGIQDPAKMLSIENGSIDVPLVVGIFNSSFECLAIRLEKGPAAPCE